MEASSANRYHSTEPMFQMSNSDRRMWRSDDGGRTWTDPLYTLWRDRFAEALTGPLYDLTYLDYLVLGTGEARVHASEKAAIVTEFKWFPNHVKAIHGLIAAGDLDEIVGALIPAAEAWGRQHGCSYAMIESREGWARVLKAADYQPHQITLIKEL